MGSPFGSRVESLPRTFALLSIELVGYALVAVWLTWPLASHVASELPGLSFNSRFDGLYSVWALAYGSHRLATDPLRLAQANIYFPTPNALFFGPTGLGALPLFAPTFLLTGNAILATNLLVLGGLTTTAAALHDVIRRWTRRHSAGVVGTAFVLTCPWISSGFVPATPHWAALTLFPVIIYVSARRLARVRDAVLLAGAIALQSMTELMYIAPALLGPLVVLGGLRLGRRASRRSGLLVLSSVALATVAILPALLKYAVVARMASDLSSQSAWGADRTVSRLPGLLFDRRAPGGVDLVTIALVTIGAVATVRRRLREGRSERDSMWSIGFLWTAVGTLLSIEMAATFFGVAIPTPRRLAATFIPAVANLHAAWRLGIAALFGEALLAGAAFAEICDALPRLAARFDAWWIRWPLAAGVVAATIAAGTPHGLERWSTFVPPSPPASFVAELRQRPGPVVVVPTGSVRFMGDSRAYAIDPIPHARAMFESIGHWQPLLNGYSSYFPAGFVETMELANRMPNPDAVSELVAKTEVRYVWVRLDELPPEKRAMWQLAVRWGLGGLKVVVREGDKVLFTTPVAPSGAGNS